MNLYTGFPPTPRNLSPASLPHLLSWLVLFSLPLGDLRLCQDSHAIEAHTQCSLVTTHTIIPYSTQQAAVTAERQGKVGQELTA